jgi:hypothetical protein
VINLASLSALLRTLRQAGGPDGPALPVTRVLPVVSLTPEDGSAGSGTAAVTAWSQSTARNTALVDDELLSASVQRRVQQAMLRDAPPGSEPSAAVPARPADSGRRESTALELTAGGRVLQSVLRGSEARPPQPPAIVGEAPLVSSPRGAAVELARGLARAIGESGLFYESHLARWVRRDYPASALGREPQAAWVAAEAPIASAGADGMQAAPLPAGATPLMTRQLDALDTRALVWIGELWPGQPASVAFEEASDDREDVGGTPASVPAQAWRTRITIDLPSLGRVDAILGFRGNALDLALETETTEARARLVQAQAALADAMTATRVELALFAVTARGRG